MTYGPLEIGETFANGLDTSVWTAAYLPAWSSRAAAAASWSTSADGLRLVIPAEHPVWCPGDHEPPLRVSAVQSGNWSGPVGSTQGQQPFRPGQRVREAQRAQWGFTPHYGRIEVTCRAGVGPGAMFSAWLIGLEDRPERCGEICLVEVFGDSAQTMPSGPTVDVGSGVHRFRDPALREDFGTERRAIDVTEPHTYAIDWTPAGVDFFIDDTRTRSSRSSPGYPMQLIIGVFDFPERRRTDRPTDDADGPELVVTRVLGRRTATTDVN
jgi:hypothetical protein